MFLVTLENLGMRSRFKSKRYIMENIWLKLGGQAEMHGGKRTLQGNSDYNYYQRRHVGAGVYLNLLGNCSFSYALWKKVVKQFCRVGCMHHCQNVPKVCFGKTLSPNNGYIQSENIGLASTGFKRLVFFPYSLIMLKKWCLVLHYQI